MTFSRKDILAYHETDSSGNKTGGIIIRPLSGKPEAILDSADVSAFADYIKE